MQEDTKQVQKERELCSSASNHVSELRGKDGKLYGKVKDGKLEIKKGSHIETFDLSEWAAQK